MTLTNEFEAVAAPPHTNHAPERPERPVVIQFEDHKPPAPRASKGVKWVRLTEEGDYAEHQIRANIRYPDSLNQALGAADFLVIRAALKRIVLEHNGWLDPETDQTMPPTNQPCQIDLDMAKALDAEKVKHADALKDAKASTKDGLETAHTVRMQQIRSESAQAKMDTLEACCFWDRVSQEEILLMLRALGAERRKLTTFLLEMKTD